MSRFERRPNGYAPGLELYLRMQPEGGGVRQPAELRGSLPGVPRPHCLVLVHGYNNHEGEAGWSFLYFRERQYQLFEDMVRPVLERRFADCFWPGDAQWPGFLDRFDFLFYPEAVSVAKFPTPLALADAIRRIPGVLAVDFIAHSLGCRLTLETVKELHAHGGPQVGRICLMAAAVPCETVEQGGEFGPLLRALQGTTQIHVLHSKSDPVLHYAFVPGQLLAGEPTAGALGRHGPPADMPGRDANVTGRAIASAGHSDYWGEESDASRDATREAGRFLQLGSQTRSIPARALDDARDLGPCRSVGDGRQV